MRSTVRLAAVLLALVLPAWAGSAALAQEAEVPRTQVQTDRAIEDLRRELDELKAWRAEREREDLKQAAEAASRAGPDEGALKPRAFQGGERALQALNPEISVTGDVGVQYVHQSGREYSDTARSGFFFRGLGIHLQSNLDPFSFFKAAVGFSPEGAEFEEGYVTWTNLLPRTSLTVGKFRQPLGVVNRWHKHALDFFDFPLMLQEPFGPGGLNQTGISLDVLLPRLWAHEETVTLQVTNGSNSKAFAGEFLSLPSVLLRLRNYWDLDRGTYLDLGLTGMFGFNHHRGVSEPAGTASVTPYDRTGAPVELFDKDGNPIQVLVATPGSGPTDEARRWTAFGGADLTVSWEPLDRSHYAGVTWRTEFLYGYKQEPGNQRISWFGGYTSLDARVAEGWSVGARGDLAQPFTVDNGGHYLWQASPYVSWWPSPFVRLHLEYDALGGDRRALEHRAILQVVFAAGPHKHDRY